MTYQIFSMKVVNFESDNTLDKNTLKLKLEKIHVFSMFSRVLIFYWQNQDHARLNWVFAAEKKSLSFRNTSWLCHET